MSSCNTVRHRLFDESISFRLYADHSSGMSVSDLAKLCSRPEHWIVERIEAARLCLEKQVRIGLSPEPLTCAEDVWAAQIWD
jgi:hypothetical protein